MQSTPSFAAREAYEFMANNSDSVESIWHSNELALMTWINKSEAIEVMRKLSNCELLRIEFDAVDGCSGTLIPKAKLKPDEA